MTTKQKDVLANLHLLQLSIDNFKRILHIDVEAIGPLMQFTGPNGAGKTSAVDAIWFLLKGIKGLPVKAVRAGSDGMRVFGRFGNEDLEFTVTRTMGVDSKEPRLEIEMIKGTREKTPQQFLDLIFDILTFDPLEFLHLSPTEKISKLRETAQVDLDFAALDAEHELDYKARARAKKEAEELTAQINGFKTLEGLPEETINEAAILTKLHEAGEANRKAQEIFRQKQILYAAAQSARDAIGANEKTIEEQAAKVEQLEGLLKQARQVLKAAETVRKSLALKAGEAQVAYESAPAGDPVDVAALTAELQSAQATNRAIAAWREKEDLKKKRAAKENERADIDQRMTERQERRRQAVANAKIPVPGLSFNETMTEILYKDPATPGAIALPLESAGEGEQLRISAEIAMAANPKLRVICVRRGEILDTAGLEILKEMATKNNFQIWMARVNEAGNVGIVLENGRRKEGGANA